MLTYYCPNCWTIVAETDKICPNCGYILEEFEKMDYEDKLLAALHHPVPERQIMAAQILGDLKSQRALPEFLKIIIGGEQDYFFLRSILMATAKVNHPDRILILEEASRHSSTLVSKLAIELIDQIKANGSSGEWDQHTG